MNTKKYIWTSKNTFWDCFKFHWIEKTYTLKRTISWDTQYFYSLNRYPFSHNCYLESIDYTNSLNTEIIRFKKWQDCNEQFSIYENYVIIWTDIDVWLSRIHNIFLQWTHFINESTSRIEIIKNTCTKLQDKNTILIYNEGKIYCLDTIVTVLLREIHASVSQILQNITINTVEEFKFLREEVKQNVLSLLRRFWITWDLIEWKIDYLLSKTFKMFKKTALEYSLHRPEYLSLQPAESFLNNWNVSDFKKFEKLIKNLIDPIIDHLKRDPIENKKFNTYTRWETVDLKVMQNLRDLAMNKDNKLVSLLIDWNWHLRLSEYAKSQWFHVKKTNWTYLSEIRRVVEEWEEYISEKQNINLIENLRLILRLFKIDNLFSLNRLPLRGNPYEITFWKNSPYLNHNS